MEAETALIHGEFAEALAQYDALWQAYEFVFLREIKIASQVAALTGDEAAAARWVRRGMAHGWSWQYIKRNHRLKLGLSSATRKALKHEYDSLHQQFLASLNDPLRQTMATLIQRDQRKALGAFLRIRSKAQDRYAARVFAPHSEQQLDTLESLIRQHGYPGERLIGNAIWTSTILSHHNSITQAYVQQDTLYPALRPLLLAAWRRGEVSPWEIALIEDWRMAATYHHQRSRYGFLGAVNSPEDLERIDKNRAEIGLRSIALRNALVDLQEETGLNLYLPGGGWLPGKLEL